VSASLTWDGGGEASFVVVEGDRVTLRSTRAFPPGAPARGVLTGAETHAVTVKVAGSKREADESFTVRGRLVSPTVALRAALRED
jgi:hypothetical protein